MSFNLTTLDTGLSPYRLANIISYSYCCSEKQGCFAEFGVMRGGSLELLAKIHPFRKVYGIDSFQGLPKGGEYDLHVEGDFAITDSEMERLMLTVPDNVILIGGYSPSVFERVAHEKFAFVHSDVDLYQSVKDSLDFFYPRLVHGGMMLFDDYGFETTPGAKKALDEAVLECQWRGELKLANNMFVGQYLIIK
jgi:O-methyltransferase